MHRLLTLILALSALQACEAPPAVDAGISRTGDVADVRLDEISGIQAAKRTPGVYFVHNDDGEPRVSAIDGAGADLGSFRIEDATNRDWEDIASMPGDHGPLLVLADSGDNFAQHPSVVLYIVDEPEPGIDGRFEGSVPLYHRVSLRYPGGPRDCESVAWDPASDRLFLISKRDKPARIYSVTRERALSETDLLLDVHGEVHEFRPPTVQDAVTFGQRDAPWVSQPTGLDISQDGLSAVVISYRSLYLFSRQPDEPWEQAFTRKPLEYEGPPSQKEEAVTFALDEPGTILVTTEGVPAPVYRFRMRER